MLRHQSNYKILDLIGQGQFGKVFAAVELNSGALVALKELKTKQLSTSSFLRELTFLVTLDHFNLVTCKALEHGQNQRYIVMDYCEGGTLRTLLNNSIPLTLNQSLKLVIDILSGLKFAHEQGIIHRDLKPENILLKTSDRSYTAHIADFGIAKLKQEVDSQNILGNTGSPAYMAPEQFYGEYSYNCDLYGVGIILYELVTGNRPFSGMPKELLAAHLSQAVKISSDIPLLLRLAISKSLEKLPSRRYQTAAEMLESLELVQAILEVDPNPQTPIRVKSNFADLVPADQSILDAPISHLAIPSRRQSLSATEQVYLVSGDRLVIQRHQNPNLSREIVADREITLNQSIQSLQFSSTGCLITTVSSLYYLSQDNNLHPFPTESNQLIATIDPQGFWLGVAHNSENSGKFRVEIYKLPDCQLQRSLIRDRVCQSAIALDSRYGLGIHQTQPQNTTFQLFNRRGNLLANFNVQIRLDSIIYHPLFPYRLLATEVDNPNMVILITLKKFHLKRISLEIAPMVMQPCPQGYLISDRQGKMIILDEYGECIGRFKIPLSSEFEVTAIAASTSELLVASASLSRSQLQRFSAKHLLIADSYI
ncbi:serine/threonine-protein kinase [Pleurocapsa sp. CCALA 161]|uniref:serine/threonine protein kinase n=1 Tax=Pleurocapsa sp. CCALA 161 TaxID=2107688 RepID=UPI00130496D1|nr:serine/threonine-protein kinase [Pleurocapsa sp. CCALA 161]